MDRDCLPSFKGPVAVCKHTCCAHFRLYSLYSTWARWDSTCKPHCSRTAPLAFNHHTNRSETEQTMSRVLHMDFDIIPGARERSGQQSSQGCGGRAKQQPGSRGFADFQGIMLNVRPDGGRGSSTGVVSDLSPRLIPGAIAAARRRPRVRRRWSLEDALPLAPPPDPIPGQLAAIAEVQGQLAQRLLLR
jgi:hypothetical protein